VVRFSSFRNGTALFGEARFMVKVLLHKDLRTGEITESIVWRWETNYRPHSKLLFEKVFGDGSDLRHRY
jgi:hypothetical protein